MHKLTGNASRDDNEVSTSEGVFQTVILWQVTGGFLERHEYENRDSRTSMLPR